MMRTLTTIAGLLAVVLMPGPAGELAYAQARRGAARQPARTAPPRVEPAKLTCTYVLGDGVQTRRTFCDVPIGRTFAEGILIPLPPHTGPVTLTFDLHARHTYSAELAKTSRGFRRYTASTGVFTADNTLLSRAVVQTEVRTAKDLFDRVAGGAGAGGVKAVAPAGVESIVITIPAEETSVSIVGEKLLEERVDASDLFEAPGRPVAVVSNVMLEYRPGPAPRAPARRK